MKLRTKFLLSLLLVTTGLTGTSLLIVRAVCVCKPFAPDTLAQRIREVLDDKSSHKDHAAAGSCPSKRHRSLTPKS